MSQAEDHGENIELSPFGDARPGDFVVFCAPPEASKLLRSPAVTRAVVRAKTTRPSANAATVLTAPVGPSTVATASRSGVRGPSRPTSSSPYSAQLSRLAYLTGEPASPLREGLGLKHEGAVEIQIGRPTVFRRCRHPCHYPSDPSLAWTSCTRFLRESAHRQPARRSWSVESLSR